MFTRIKGRLISKPLQISGLYCDSCSYSFAWNPEKKLFTFLYFFFIHSESSAFANNDFLNAIPGQYKRLPESDDYSIGFEIKAALFTPVFITNLKRDFGNLKERYYAATVVNLLQLLAKEAFHKYSFNLNKRDFICASKTGSVKRRQNQLLLYSAGAKPRGTLLF